jgi:hypothetical protein
MYPPVCPYDHTLHKNKTLPPPRVCHLATSDCCEAQNIGPPTDTPGFNSLSTTTQEKLYSDYYYQEPG